MSAHYSVSPMRRFQGAFLGALLATVATLVAPLALAGPANIKPVIQEQPDGTRLSVRMRGDEFQGWMETADGYTVVRNPETGYLEYATKDVAGDLVPSGIVAVPDAAARSGLLPSLPPKGLRPPRNAEREAGQKRLLESVYRERLQPVDAVQRGQTGTWAPKPVAGTKKLLVILVNFTDQTIDSNGPTDWYNAIVNPGAASVAKYYKDNSYDKLKIAAVPHTQAGSPDGVVSVTIARRHPACKGGDCSYATESAVINAALAAAAAYVNFPSLDTDADGTISVGEALFYFIWAGYETSGNSGLTPSIWAHAWGGAGVAVSGKEVPVWAINGELYNRTTRMPMGVAAHELGHQMAGMPDLYDTADVNEGIGIFSLMAAGSWGARKGEVGGTTPTGYDAWSRQYLGWSAPQVPTDGQTVTLKSGLAGETSSDKSAVILIDENVSSSEFWLVENRPPVGWDGGIYAGFDATWQGGLLIQHIDLNIGNLAANNFNRYVAGGHQGNTVVEASSATCTLMSGSKKSWGCPSLLYYAGNNAAFDDGSTPNSRHYSGRSSGFGVSSISAPGESMTATFTRSSVNKTLAALDIEGPATVNEDGTASYSATATYTDGSSYKVRPYLWSENSPWATISDIGLLDTDTVTADEPVTISASYTEGGITRTATEVVTIVNSTTETPGATTTALLLEHLAGATGSEVRYEVKVPAGAANLVFSTAGSVGNVDLYVKAGAQPGETIDTSDCSSYTPYDTEVCTIPAPQAGTWHILLKAYAGYSEVTLQVTYETPVALTIQKEGTGNGTVQSTAVASRYAVRGQAASAEPRIVGGFHALAASWPWQVALETSAGSQFCGGSLLSERWVVTAAHCISDGSTVDPPGSVKVRVGSLVEGSGGQQVAVSRIIAHPQYNADASDNDIALLELATPVTLSSTVAAVDPLLPSDEPSIVVDGKLATVTGWGRIEDGGSSSTTLRQVTLPLLTSASCRATGYGSQITDNMICAGYAFGEKDACQGDSGGPLVVPNGRGGWVLAGVVSWGTGCAAKNYPGIYTRVANYRSWLESNTGLTFGQPLIDCGSACAAQLGLNSTVTLTASPAPGSSFVGWSGGCSGSGSPCTVAMDAARNVSAQFRYVGNSGASSGAVRDAFIAYYGRPADPAGLAYWTSVVDARGGDINAVLMAFGNSAEYTRRFGGLTNTQMVTLIYQQSLARNPDAAGLAWYVAELDAGRTTLQRVAMDVYYGAKLPPDADVVTSKRLVADYYTTKVAAGCAYGTEQTGIDLLKIVTDDYNTQSAAKAAIDARCAR